MPENTRINVTSATSQTFKYLLSLKQHQVQKDGKEFMVQGSNLIVEASIAKLLQAIIVAEEAEMTAFKNIKTTIYVVKRFLFDRLVSGKSKQQYLGIVSLKEKMPIVLDRVVYLLKVQNPSNVGAIIRTSYAFGAETIVLSESASPFDYKAILASEGAIFHVNIVFDNNLSLFLKTHPDHQAFLTILDQEATKLDEISVPSKYILVFGNEGQGLNLESLGQYQKLYLPITNFDSLNVAVAHGIIMYKFRK
ncbi:MAG: RNA methyltransferase [Erysipelotrichaceae bacterium]|jgi:TrmH family RNA methyltransferase|nr:RNA methyltransferase [Erysipelotrichaceae bacterium]